MNRSTIILYFQPKVAQIFALLQMCWYAFFFLFSEVSKEIITVLYWDCVEVKIPYCTLLQTSVSSL